MSRKYGGRHAAEPSHLGEANAAHTPSPVCLNNQPPVRFDRLAQHFVMGAERHPHPVGVGPPPTEPPKEQRTPTQDLTTDTPPPRTSADPDPDTAPLARRRALPAGRIAAAIRHMLA
jgi:hypothetical protein